MKAKKILKTIDKDLQDLRKKTNTIAIENLTTDDRRNGWKEDVDDGLEDLDLNAYEDEDEEPETKVFLPQLPDQSKPRLSSRSRWLCFFCLVLIVLSVIFILWFAEYEYEIIERETLSPAEQQGNVDHAS